MLAQESFQASEAPWESVLSFVMLQVSKVDKARDDAAGAAAKQAPQARTLEARIDLLRSTLDSIKEKESTGSGMEFASSKAADVKCNMNEFSDGLHCDTLNSCASIRHIVRQSLVKVSRRLKEVLDCDAASLQQGD